jgi:hypothetical protein
MIAAIASIFFANDVLAYFARMAQGVNLPIHYMILGFSAFCVTMVYTSTISLSIEGKRFWIMKSLPVAPTTVTDAKIAFNILLGSAPTLVAVPLFAFGFGFGFIDAVTMILALIGLSVMTSSLGALVNLRFPKFNFLHEVELVKQSLAALVGVFGGFAILATAGFALWGLAKFVPWQAGLSILGVIALMIGLLLRLRADRVAERLFIRLGP